MGPDQKPIQLGGGEFSFYILQVQSLLLLLHDISFRLFV